MATRWTSKHTGQKIDDTIDYVCNPNLLDNWYFGNPVNQRGQTEYTALGYTIDRWKLPAVHKLTVQDSGIKITCNSSAGVNFCFHQLVENLEVGKQYTLSALITENTTTKGVSLRRGNSGHNPVKGTGVYAYTFVAASTDLTSGVGMQFIDRADDNNNYFVLKAIKLELGSQQTLAHQDADSNWILNEIPDYGEQLARCQRYYQVFDYTNAYVVIAFGHAAETTVFRGLIPTLIAMRTKPTIVFTGASKSLVLYGNSSAVIASSAPYSVITAGTNGVGFIMTVSGLTKNETYVLQVYNCKLELSADL